MQTAHVVNVRALAEFSLESGDLVTDGRAVERMREGMAGHLAVQGLLDREWRCEEPVSRQEEIGDITLTVQGRADAVRRRPGMIAVEEIKTTRLQVYLIGENDYPVHWAQAQIYAYILCKNENVDFAEVALLYYNMDGTRTRFSRQYNIENLTEIFFTYAVPYAEWLRALDARTEAVIPTIHGFKFPFPNYRDGQKELARNTFIALRDGRRLLAEAPTGIGKTAATLFGAIKALGTGHITNIFYLTARTTGRAAAENALNIMRAHGLVIRSVTLTAKDKCCARTGGVRCDDCPYAVAYYDRRRDALREALDIQRLGAEEIFQFAAEWQLCPFELSLDLSEQADVIICDYNYAFDPRVHLKRYFEGKTRAALLIDEAHNLPERARDMLSAELSGRRIEELRREVGKVEGRKTGLYPVLTELLTALTIPLEQPESRREPPTDLPETAEKIADIIANHIAGGHPLANDLIQFMFECVWFARVARTLDDATFRVIVEPEGKRARVKLWCFDPSKHIKATFKKVRGAALFSATLAPMEFYAREMAIAEKDGDALLKLASPFPPENLLVLRLPVPTRYRERERTIGDVAEAIYAMCAARPGNYLACFPSHAYLAQAHQIFAARHPEVRCLMQQTGMDEAARTAFLDQLQPGATTTTLAFIAMGGVFAEGVDLPGDRVIGAAIIGAGVPQISFERSLLCELSDEEMGYDFAYTYPGMRRVLQAAGRVIRTEDDRGVVLLVDDRFWSEKYTELMPDHWQVRDAKTVKAVANACAAFWRKK